MDIHPWTKYEVARMRDEERLLRARAAMRSRELRNPEHEQVVVTEQRAGVFERILRRGLAARHAPAGSSS